MKVMIALLVVCVCLGAEAMVIVDPPPHPYSQPLTSPPAVVPEEAVVEISTRIDDYDPYPDYLYAYYDIEDESDFKGDLKRQQETRSGDVVQDSYTSAGPDGSRRAVQHVADPDNDLITAVYCEPIDELNDEPIDELIEELIDDPIGDPAVLE